MNQDDHSTDVMFRVWGRDHELFALMPGLLGTYSPHTCTSYAHVGQHGSADPRYCIAKSRPAIPAEYRALKAELEGLGYRVRVIQRSGPHHLRQRKADLARITTSR